MLGGVDVTLIIRKLLGDVAAYKRRTLSVVLAIFLGCFGFSVVANSYSILMREMNRNYMNTNPASAVLWTDSISGELLQNIKAQLYIKDAETSQRVVGRVQVGDNTWKELWLFVIPSFENVKIDRFFPEKGKPAPSVGEIFLERKALAIANASLYQDITVKVPGGVATSLHLTGTVHAPGLAPAWMEGGAYGYVTPETFKLLGGSVQETALKIVAAGDTMNKGYNKEVATQLKEFLQKQGVTTYQIDVPQPGQHPHYSQMAALLVLMEAFGLLALCLSGVLTANLISFLMAQQKRQIGVMKAIGASFAQVAGMYLSMVFAIAAVALLVAVPCGILAGRGYAQLAATILNFDIFDQSIPHGVILCEIVIGLLVPLLTALLPILRGCGITVRAALQDYGIEQEKFSGRNIDKTTARWRSMPRPLVLSLRNTLRRRGRLVFTIAVMAVGGMGFLTAMNVYASMYRSIETKLASIGYDIQIDFTQPIQEAALRETISCLPQVKSMETWGGAQAAVLYEDGTVGESFGVIAPSSDTQLLRTPPLQEGRWLTAGDINGIVLNQQLVAKEPTLNVGDDISLCINGNNTTWHVVGIAKEMMGLPTAYVNSARLTELFGLPGYASTAVVETKAVTPKEKAAVIGALEARLAASGADVRSLQSVEDYRAALKAHLVLIASFLVLMSALVVLVGGLGLATTVSINVMERRREIGVMRAIGASPRMMTGINMVEGILMGVFGWLVALVFSWPLGRLISDIFGLTFFKVPLDYAVSIPGIVIWLGIAVGFAALSSYMPSRIALQVSVREALSYE